MEHQEPDETESNKPEEHEGDDDDVDDDVILSESDDDEEVTTEMLDREPGCSTDVVSVPLSSQPKVVPGPSGIFCNNLCLSLECNMYHSISISRSPFLTSSSAITEGPRDASSQFKSCQLLHHCTKNHI